VSLRRIRRAPRTGSEANDFGADGPLPRRGSRRRPPRSRTGCLPARIGSPGRRRSPVGRGERALLCLHGADPTLGVGRLRGRAGHDATVPQVRSEARSVGPGRSRRSPRDRRIRPTPRWSPPPSRDPRLHTIRSRSGARSLVRHRRRRPRAEADLDHAAAHVLLDQGSSGEPEARRRLVRPWHLPDLGREHGRRAIRGAHSLDAAARVRERDTLQALAIHEPDENGHGDTLGGGSGERTSQAHGRASRRCNGGVRKGN
jgi:hypothetical protein